VRIGELARRSGLSRDTLRFYERIGLLVSHRDDTSGNRYKDYPEAMLQRLRLVGLAQSLGFTLREISVIVRLAEGSGLGSEDREPLLRGKLAEIDRKLDDLRQLRDAIAAALHCQWRASLDECLEQMPAGPGIA
jgi:DNA-binding transcriptional MerR regulator